MTAVATARLQKQRRLWRVRGVNWEISATNKTLWLYAHGSSVFFFFFFSSFVFFLAWGCLG